MLRKYDVEWKRFQVSWGMMISGSSEVYQESVLKNHNELIFFLIITDLNKC